MAQQFRVLATFSEVQGLVSMVVYNHLDPQVSGYPISSLTSLSTRHTCAVYTYIQEKHSYT